MSTREVRRSRSERTADSRQLILDATLRCLFELGYAGTTTLTIQARAGVSRGRLLHHFPSRDALLVAACRHLVTRHLAEAEGMAAREMAARETAARETAAGSDGGDRLDRAVGVLWSTFHQPHSWGFVELWTAARTDPALREALLPEERRMVVAIRRVVDALFGPAIAAHSRYPGTRELLFTSMRGVALTYALERRDPAQDPHLAVWRDTARTLLEAPATP